MASDEELDQVGLYCCSDPCEQEDYGASCDPAEGCCELDCPCMKKEKA